ARIVPQIRCRRNDRSTHTVTGGCRKEAAACHRAVSGRRQGRKTGPAGKVRGRALRTAAGPPPPIFAPPPEDREGGGGAAGVGGFARGIASFCPGRVLPPPRPACRGGLPVSVIPWSLPSRIGYPCW